MTSFPPETVASITGAASGLGLATAKALILDGITKISLIDLPQSSLPQASSTLKSLSPSPSPNLEILTLGIDCTQEEEVEEAVKETVRKFGRIDVCFNAAGISGKRGRMHEMHVERLDDVLGLNLRGVWLCERAEIRQFLRLEMRSVCTGLPLKTRGSIVNVGSLCSHNALEGMNHYIMAKHGVLGLSKADALDYGTDGIRINCICPGFIETPMTQYLPGTKLQSTARAPMGRWGKPEEVAYPASFFLSDRASFITGAAIHVDGGYAAA